MNEIRFNFIFLYGYPTHIKDMEKGVLLAHWI